MKQHHHHNNNIIPISQHKVSDVGDKLVQAVAPFGCQLVEGVMCHDVKQFVIDGAKVRCCVCVLVVCWLCCVCCVCCRCWVLL